MKKSIRGAIPSSSIYILVCFLLIAGCSEKVVNDNSGNKLSIVISTRLTSPDKAAQYGDILLSVSGQDIDPRLEFELSLSDGYILGQIEVPSGLDRHFELSVYDTLGILIYYGETDIDLVKNDTIDVNIPLRPQVSMLKLSPHFVRTPQGTSAKVDVMVYRVNGLNTIEFDLKYLTYQLFPYKAELNPAYGDMVKMERMRDGDYILKIWNENSGGTIVNDTGYARLASITFYTYTPNIPEEQVQIDIEPINIINSSGQQVPVSQVHTDNATLELFDIFDYMVAYWRMNDETASSVEDVSDNSLDGIATGTEIVPGPIGTARLFNGTGDYITVPYNNLMDLDDEITISFWIKSGLHETDGTILSKAAENGSINYQVEYTRSGTSGGDLLYFKFGSSPANCYSVPVNLRDLGWHHVALSHVFGHPEIIKCVFDGKTADGYWLEPGTYQPITTNSSELLMGRRQGNIPNFLNGTLDEVFILDTALDRETLLQLYYGPTAKKAP